MDFGFISSSLSSIDLEYVKYATIILALIPIVINVKDEYFASDKYGLMSFIFLVGAIGILYLRYQTWIAIPSDSFDDYLSFSFYSFVFLLLPIANFFTKPDGFTDEKAISNILINGIVFLISVLWAFYSFIKAYLAIPTDGYSQYFELTCIFAVPAIICLVYILLTRNEYIEKPLTYYLVSGFFVVCSIGTLGFLVKTLTAIPSYVYAGAALVLILLFGGVFGSNGHE